MLLTMAPRRTPDVLRRLSARELEVLALMAEGHANQRITRELVLSERTVETHVRSIYRKLDVPAGTGQDRRVTAVLLYLEAVSAREAAAAVRRRAV